MPLNVRRFCTSVLLVLVAIIAGVSAQTVPSQPVVQQAAPPSSGDVMRDRISKAKAYIAVRNYNAAIYELENIRRETGDTAVQSVVNVLLMNSYLEQGDYKRAQDFLNIFFNEQKTTKPNAAAIYMSVAGQVVKGARSRVERYRALGLSVSDRTLPLEASNDLEKMRETLELVITQATEIGKDAKKTADAMAMVEEASTSRGMLARDDYDARRWKDSVADAREEMSNSRSVVLNAVNDTAGDGGMTASTATVNTPATNTAAVIPPPVQPVQQQAPVNKPLAVREREVKPADSTVAKNDKPVIVVQTPPQPKAEPKPAETKTVSDNSPLDVGSLVNYATRQSQPTYPPVAKTTRTTGVVKVEVMVDEKGEVAEVQKTSGPSMLQGAAKDAIRKWKFKPFVRDGQPVRATGFVNFNFAL
ncbi:MAG: energy transducer TonB [Pyrinomonadaceae bacterium]|nr:energy transducer TonB [Pyrinomonadaceae bacterium]